MHAMKVFSTVALTLIALLTPAFFIQTVKADNGTAKVYILMLPNVGGSWVGSCEQVKDGAIEACMLRGEFIDQNVPRAHPRQEGVNYPPYYSAMPVVVTSWTTYKNIIISEAGVIIVNTHGQILPVPSGYPKEQWVDKISEAMLTRRISWVHVAMYPFYYVKYENGTSETWGENGFKYFMGHINKGYVDCLLPGNATSTETTRIEHSKVLYDNNMIGNWVFGDANPIKKFWYAELGRPLKGSNFKDYLIMPLYEINDTGSLDVYMTGAVIAYVKAGQRSLTDYGCGVYVHLGVRYFYDADGNQMANTDFGRGFIGTAAALWVEANRFKPSAASWEKSVGDWVWNATVFAHPTVIGFEELDSSYIKVRLGFGVHGIYKFPEEREGMGARFEEARFGAWIDSENWSDVWMKADINNPALSKQAIGFGTELSELNTEREEEFRGLATSTIIYIGSLIPGVGYFFDAIEGLMLFGQWGGFVAGGSGIDEYDTLVDIWYNTISLHSEPIDGYVYAETSSIVILDVRIPTSTRSDWMILPFTYCIYVAVETGIPADFPYWIGPIEKTIDIAIFFDRGAGQEDAGISGDAGNDLANARGIGFPGSYHGYLDGDADNVDWYTFYIQSGKVIHIRMTPPPYVNFDLELHRPDGRYVNGSYLGAGVTDTVKYTADTTGWWKVNIFKVHGSGVYSLELGRPSLTVKTRKTTGSQISAKVWIDDVEYCSPVTLNVDAGTHTVEVESYFFKREWWVYTFDRWEDGSTANPRMIPIDDDMTVTAYYTEDYLCPTLFVWNGSQYVYEALLNIHAESDVTVQHQIQQTLVQDDLFYKLQLRELDNFTSHIDQVKLYAVDSEGEWHSCPLAYVCHSELGKITWKLRFDDSKRVDLHPTEIIDLKFLPSIPHSETAHFMFEINGYNRKIDP